MQERPRGVDLRLLMLFGLFLLPARGNAQSLSGLDEYIEKGLVDWEVPGLSISIVRDDSVIYAKGFGVKEFGKPDRVTEHTNFAIGSSTKGFTSALVAQLVDEGKLDWDDRVQKYLSGFEVSDPYVSRELTIRDLLSHRTGLARGDALTYGMDYDRNEIIRRARYLEQEWSFRSTFTYSNIMYLVAGQLAAKVAGKSWDDLIQDRIFTPLGMLRSNTSTLANARLMDFATPHARFDNRIMPVPWRDADNVAPAGAINSNAVDMAQWLRMQLNHGKFDGKQLISQASIREMQSPNTLMFSDERTERLVPETHFRAYGLGWFLQDYRGHEVVLHGGNRDGMTALVWMVPEEKFGIVILTNRNASNLPTALAYRITDLLTGGAGRDWSAEYLTFTRAAQARAREADDEEKRHRVPDTKPTLPLERYVGVYEQKLYGRITVDLRDGKLMIRRSASVDGTLEHWHFDVFRAVWNDRMLGSPPFVTFLIDSQARVQSLRVDGLGEFTRKE